MRKIIHFSPAYDKRDPRPSKDYGVHGMDLLFILKGPEGAITFEIFTNWYLPHVKKECFEQRGKIIEPGYGSYLSRHTPTPQYNDENPVREPGGCEYVPKGMPCYADGSGLQAIELFDRFVAEGQDWLWKELQKYYDSWVLGKEVTF